MPAILKKFSREILIVFMLVAVYLLTRLVNLTLIPIFTDEAIYLRWSQIMAYDSSLRYLPLVDGKPPLFMWLTSFLIRVLPNWDVLALGRLTSVGAGLGSLAGVLFTSFVFFRSRRISLISGILYIITPFTLFYDRIALADSLLLMWGIWSLGLSYVMFKSLRLDVALVLGIIIGLAHLTKTPAIFYLAFMPIMFVFFDLRRKDLPGRLFKLVGLLFLVVIFSQSIYSVLRLFPLFHMIAQKNQEFIVPLSEVMKSPFHLMQGNLPSLVSWEVGYLTFPVFALALIAFLLGIFQRKITPVILFAYFLLPVLVVSAINKIIYVRYLLPFTAPLLILAAFSLDRLISSVKSRMFLVLVGLFVLVYPVLTDFLLITHPTDSPIPDADSRQYLNSWPAGFGVSEVRNFLKEESEKNAKVTIGTEGTFGLMPYALELYQKEYPNVEIKPYWPVKDHEIPPEIMQASRAHPTYFLIYQRQDVPLGWNLEKILEFKQGLGTDKLRLYRVLPI